MKSAFVSVSERLAPVVFALNPPGYTPPLVYALPRSPTGLALPAGGAAFVPWGGAFFLRRGGRNPEGVGRFFFCGARPFPGPGERPPDTTTQTPHARRSRGNSPPKN